MAVTVIGDRAGAKNSREYTSEETGVRELVRVIKATTSLPGENEDDVAAAIGIYRGQPFATVSGQIVWVQDFEVQEIAGNGVDFWLWEATYNYSSEANDRAETEDPSKPPEQRSPIWSATSETIRTVIYRDQVAGGAIANAAKQPLPIEDFEVVSILNLVRYERETLADLYARQRAIVNHTNNLAFLGAEPEHLLCSSMTFRPANKDGDPDLREVTYILKYRTNEGDGWKVRLENLGTEALHDGKIQPILIKNGQLSWGDYANSIQVERYLMADGSLAPSDGKDRPALESDATVGPFSVKPTADFSVIPIA